MFLVGEIRRVVVIRIHAINVCAAINAVRFAMRLNDPIPGIIMQVDAISPETERAQRMAELKNIAEYRARHLQYIKDWSDPDKRAKIQAVHAVEERQARESLAGESVDNYRVRTVQGGMSRIVMTEIVKPTPKLSWYKRLLNWFRR